MEVEDFALRYGNYGFVRHLLLVRILFYIRQPFNHLNSVQGGKNLLGHQPRRRLKVAIAEEYGFGQYQWSHRLIDMRMRVAKISMSQSPSNKVLPSS